MAEPYMPTSPIVAPGLPPITVEAILLETLLELILAQSGKKRRARMIVDLYKRAEELESAGNLSRIRSPDRPSERAMLEKYRQAGATLRAWGDLSSRLIIEGQGR